jgi:hypothetical protein
VEHKTIKDIMIGFNVAFLSTTADQGCHEPSKLTCYGGFPDALLPCPDSILLQFQYPVIQTFGMAVGSALQLGIANFFMEDSDMAALSSETHKPLHWFQ